MKKLKLMVIDDNREFCRLIKEYVQAIEEIEFCGVAFDGISALSAIKERKPDVILLDTVMPELDGIGVMKHIKNLSTKPKVIVVSSSPTNFVITEMYRLGADYIISKNTDTADIIDRCIMVCNQKEITENVEELITNAVCAIGIPASLKGYSYLRTSVNAVIDKPDTIHSITKTLYPYVAKRHNTTSSKVERNIRHAIEIAWEKGDKKELAHLFGTPLVFTNPKPTNSEFIAILADKLRLKKKQGS